jgi:chromosome segregation ATPase
MRFATEHEENIRHLDSKLRNISLRIGEMPSKPRAQTAHPADKQDYNTADLTAAIEKIDMAGKLVEFSIGRVRELELEVRNLQAELKNSDLRGATLEQKAEAQRERAERAEELAASTKARANELGEDLAKTQKKLEKLTSVIHSAFPALNDVGVIAA